MPPDLDSSPSQRNHLACAVIIWAALVMSVWWNPEFPLGSAVPVKHGRTTSRSKYGYSSASVPSEWPSSCSEISGPCGEPPDVVASTPPMPP